MRNAPGLRHPRLESPADSRDLDYPAPEVVIRSNGATAAEVRLHDRRSLGEYETTFTVALHAAGLEASVGEVSVTPWDGGGLPGFMDALAAGFRGWSGTRSWAVGLLKVTAAFRSGGHVELRWAIRPCLTPGVGWEASLTTRVEGGQQMTDLAAAVRDFLTPAQPAELPTRHPARCRRPSGQVPTMASSQPTMKPPRTSQSRPH